MKTLVTKDLLKDMLDVDKYGHEYVETVVGRALWSLFMRQNKDEQSSNITNHNNGIGFTGADAHSGSITAKYWKKWGNLGYAKGDKWRLEKWTKAPKNSKGGYPRLCKYAEQLNEIANEKMAADNAKSTTAAQ